MRWEPNSLEALLVIEDEGRVALAQRAQGDDQGGSRLVGIAGAAVVSLIAYRAYAVGVLICQDWSGNDQSTGSDSSAFHLDDRDRPPAPCAGIISGIAARRHTKIVRDESDGYVQARRVGTDLAITRSKMHAKIMEVRPSPENVIRRRLRPRRAVQKGTTQQRMSAGCQIGHASMLNNEGRVVLDRVVCVPKFLCPHIRVPNPGPEPRSHVSCECLHR